MKRWTLLIVVALLVLSLACSFGKSEPTSSTPATSEATMESPASGGNGSSQATTEPADGNGGETDDETPFTEADLEGLDSYRSMMTYRTETEDGTVKDEGSIYIEETREPQAYHMVITDKGEDGGTMEIIIVGQDQWINLDGEWMYSQASPDEMDDFGMGMIFTPDEIFSGAANGDYDYVGKEKINGIRTKHYRFDLDPAQAADFGDVTDMTEGQADVWVADEPNLPHFPVKLVIVTKGEIEDGVQGTATIEMEITDVNAPITIEPPADAAAGLPGDLPEYPNATDVAILGDMYSFQTGDDVATVQSFYEEALNNAGWTKSETTEMEGMVMQTWTKDNESIMLMISAADEGGSSVIITAGE